MSHSSNMRDRLACVGCYPTAVGKAVAEEDGADAIRANIVADLADLGPADLLAVYVVVGSLASDARCKVAQAADVMDLGELDGLGDELGL